MRKILLTSLLLIAVLLAGFPVMAEETAGNTHDTIVSAQIEDSKEPQTVPEESSEDTSNASSSPMTGMDNSSVLFLAGIAAATAVGLIIYVRKAAS